MKNIKTIIIFVLIASNAFFVGAYLKVQNEVSGAKLIADESYQKAQQAASDARQAQQMAEENRIQAEAAIAQSNEQVTLMKEQLEACKK
ncbi:MAG: hypothetical protein R8G66_08025 [Cytophagales bacterium]|nr:hypothetical protein [Cytophagales bacterium]